jgi:hypothetical protein
VLGAKHTPLLPHVDQPPCLLLDFVVSLLLHEAEGFGQDLEELLLKAQTLLPALLQDVEKLRLQ